ncbi:hypothetical protein XPA_010238 [Xanthoria parietina]
MSIFHFCEEMREAESDRLYVRLRDTIYRTNVMTASFSWDLGPTLLTQTLDTSQWSAGFRPWPCLLSVINYHASGLWGKAAAGQEWMRHPIQAHHVSNLQASICHFLPSKTSWYQSFSAIGVFVGATSPHRGTDC